MDVEVFPLIAPNDYVAFRALLRDNVPDTYDEWRKLQTDEIRQFVMAGRAIREVPVYSHQFANYLRARGANANLVSLRNFTIEVDDGYRY